MFASDFKKAHLVLFVLFQSTMAAHGAEILWKRNIEAGMPDTSVFAAEITDNPGLELVYNTTSGKLIAADLDGNTLWSVSTHAVFCNAPTVADLFPGGGAEILTISRQGALKCFSSDGEELWEYLFPSGLDWNQTTIVAFDIDRDGRIEVLAGDGSGDFRCLDRFGREKWSYQFIGGFHCPPAVGDLDDDGYSEIVVTTGDGDLVALNHDGSEHWRTPLGYDNISGPVLADLDLDGDAEIVVGAVEPFLHCYSHEGALVWKVPIGEKGIDSTISVGNLSGDERLEIVCINLQGECFCFDADGKELWKADFGTRSRRAPSLADFNGDGKLEILVTGYFGQVVLLSGEGEELDRTPAAITNGGATLIDYNGRLAAIIPFDNGEMSCMTWAPEGSEKNPPIAWGAYRVDNAQTGAVPNPRAKVPLESPPEAPQDFPEIRDLSSEIATLEKALQKVTGVEVGLDAKGAQLAEVRSTRYEIQDTLTAVRDAEAVMKIGWEEEALRLRRKTEILSEEAEAIVEKAKRILDLAQGDRLPKLIAWPTNPWRQIYGVEKENPERLVSNKAGVFLYRNEVESLAFNLMNLDTRSVPVRVKAAVRMAGEGSPRLELREIVSVPTETEDYSDDAAPLMNQGRTIHLAPGETRQVFLSIYSEDSPAETYKTPIEFETVSLESQSVSLTVTAEVVDLDIEEGTPPRVCTWGYVAGSFLKDYPKEAWRDRTAHGNNVIVLSGHLFPKGEYDETGEIRNDLDFSALGEFIEKRPGAMFLFLGYTGALHGPSGHGEFSPAYQKAFDTWLGAVVEYLKGIGVGYDRFALYPIDEPGLHPGSVDRYIAYARAARKADPNVLMYTDQVDGADLNDIRRMAHLVDISCPNRNHFLLEDDDPRFEIIKNNSKILWTYECEHSAKHRPPLEYYRGLAWLGKMRGTSGFGFWTYCTTSDDPWQFPKNRSHDYPMVYPGEGVVASRRWEAVRDGVEDLHAVALLESEIEKAEGGEDLETAKRTLQEAISELGRFGIRGTGTEDLEVLGGGELAAERADAEWYAYGLHRKKIAEATLRLKATPKQN